MINKSKAVVLFLCMSLIMTIFSKSIVFAAEEKSSQNAELTQDEVLESFYLELLAQMSI